MKTFLDAATLADVEKYADVVDGFTSNPALMRKAGITDYRTFARALLDLADGKPVSFEVLADDPDNAFEQAHTINGFGPNVWVKIPVIWSNGESTSDLIARLIAAGIKVNATCAMTAPQILDAWAVMRDEHSFVSVFAGRIMDTGVDAERIIGQITRMGNGPKPRLLWASTREVYNHIQASRAGCEYITMTPDLLQKMKLIGKSLDEYSRETVQQFVNDAKGISL